MAVSIQTGVITAVHPNRGASGAFALLDSDSSIVQIRSTPVPWPQATEGARVYLLVDSAVPTVGFMLGIANKSVTG